MVPEYRPGAGGVVAANYLYNVAPKDGTVIGIPLAPIVLAQYTGANVQYDASKFLWVGQMADITRLFAVWETSPIKTFEDLITKESIAGTTGRGSETYMNPALMNARVRHQDQDRVTATRAQTTIMLALERGEMSAVSGTWANFAANHPQWISEQQGPVRGADRAQQGHRLRAGSAAVGAREERRRPPPGGIHVAGHHLGRLFGDCAARCAGPDHRRAAQRLRCAP